MRVKAEPRKLLASVEGFELAELSEPEVCCGFGGLFSVKYPEISERMADDKIADAREDRRGLIGGRRSRLPAASRRTHGAAGQSLRVRHVAEVLADMGDEPALGEHMNQDPRNFMPASHEALADPKLKVALGRLKTHFQRGRTVSTREFSAISKVCANRAAPSAIMRCRGSTRCWNCSKRA